MDGGHTVLCSVQGTNTVVSTIHKISLSRLSSHKTTSLTGLSRKPTSKKCGVFIGIYKNLCGEIGLPETRTALIISAYILNISLIFTHSLINSSVAFFFGGGGNYLLGTKGYQLSTRYQI